jgi:hypothetical protein
VRAIMTLPLFAAAMCFSGATRAQVNYDLLAKVPAPSSSGSTVTQYSAIVLSYRDRKAYICTGEWGDLNDALGDRWLHFGCLPDFNFRGSLLSDRNTAMKRSKQMHHGVRVPVPEPIESHAAQRAGQWEDYFWQIDQSMGQVQLCYKGASGGSCIRWDIQPTSAAPDAPASSPARPRRAVKVDAPQGKLAIRSVIATSTRPACTKLTCGRYAPLFVGIAF